jgi:carbonic anhydrase
MNITENKELVDFLNRMFNTNEKFIGEHSVSFFDEFADEQNPMATVLKCSDSRVQMESFEEEAQNGIFTIRNIGNQISTNMGSIEYGVRVLGTPFLVIMGHSDCGAVKSAITTKTTNNAHIDKELSSLHPLHESDIKLAVLENVKHQVELALRNYADLVENGKLTVIGLIYDFKNDYGFGNGKLILTHTNNCPFLFDELTGQMVIPETYCIEGIDIICKK